MLLATHLLTLKKYLKAREKGVKTFLFNETDFELPQFDGVNLLNCTNQRVPSTWYTWQKNEALYLSFKTKFPQFFQWGKYDLSLAFQKAIYWANQKTGFLHYVKDTFFSAEVVYAEDSLYGVHSLKTWIKCAFQSIKQRPKQVQVNKQKAEETIGIYINEEFQLVLYKTILWAVAGNKKFKIFIKNRALFEKITALGVGSEQIHACAGNIFFKKFPLINFLSLNKNELYVLNLLAMHWQEIAEWIGLAEEMASAGIKSLLMNEGENGIFGAVIGEVMRQNGITTYNSMNGMKAGQAQDSYINFDYWFVWDEQMKKMLTEKNHLNPDMLLVSGHLMEDEVKRYTYQNSIGVEHASIEGRKVISLFSVRGKREEKIQVFHYLYNVAEKNSNILLLVRLHPSEKEEDSVSIPVGLENIRLIPYDFSNSKTTLYDQLSISNLSICFGSTVALESTWFGVPCITVEKREESLIYAVDGKRIVKAEKLEDALFYKMLNNNQESEVKNKDVKVADFITNILQGWIKNKNW